METASLRYIYVYDESCTYHPCTISFYKEQNNLNVTCHSKEKWAFKSNINDVEFRHLLARAKNIILKFNTHKEYHHVFWDKRSETFSEKRYKTSFIWAKTTTLVLVVFVFVHKMFTRSSNHNKLPQFHRLLGCFDFFGNFKLQAHHFKRLN